MTNNQFSGRSVYHSRQAPHGVCDHGNADIGLRARRAMTMTAVPVAKSSCLGLTMKLVTRVALAPAFKQAFPPDRATSLL